MGRLSREGRRKRKETGKRPGPEAFTEGAIQRAVLSDTVQHPLTILPAAVAALGGLYMGLNGLGPAPFAVAFGGGMLSAAAWVVNYFFRGEGFAVRHVRKLRAQRDQHRLDELAALESQWAAAGHAEGVQQARELRQAYERLDGFLAQRSEAHGGLDVERFRVLAEDTYAEGVRILRLALETQQALMVLDVEKLRRELTTWQREWNAARDLGIDDPRLSGHEKRIAGHQRRLELFDQRQASLAEMLAESEELESALETAYLEVVDLKGAEGALTQGKAGSALEQSVAAARRVEDRMRQAMTKNHEADQVYLEAGSEP